MLNAPTRESQWSRSDREYLQENRIQQSMGIVSKIRPRSSSADVKGLACIILELMLIHSPKQSWKNNEESLVDLLQSLADMDITFKEHKKQREESLVDPEELALAGRRLHEKYIEAQNGLYFFSFNLNVSIFLRFVGESPAFSTRIKCKRKRMSKRPLLCEGESTWFHVHCHAVDACNVESGNGGVVSWVVSVVLV
ncbi:hypothetical protein L1049_011798 [Liquidambar formosana]|uniref:Uncharacterized protein n=1 Tax=Liquidambar formosana TaxID=63359 RepID=A0AAP0RS13_LIQFO